MEKLKTQQIKNYSKLKNEFKLRSMLRIKVLHEDATIPTKGHKGDAGWDVYSRETRVLNPGEIYAFPLGFTIIGKQGMVYKIEDKSSLALRGIRTGGGIIDNNYRGECHAIVQNVNGNPMLVEKGNKIAQLLPMYVADGEELELHTGPLDETSRNDGKFGSTGI